MKYRCTIEFDVEYEVGDVNCDESALVAKLVDASLEGAKEIPKHRDVTARILSE